MESLKIPEKYRRTGLYIYCYKCKRYSNIKTGSLKKAPDCTHPPDRQVYKIKIHFPGTRNISRTLALKTRDIKEVDKMRLEFIESLKTNNYNNPQIPSDEVDGADRYLLTYQMKRYLEFITNGGFYEFEAPRELNVGTINDYKRNFKYFIESIASAVNIKTVRVDEIHREHIELFHKYLKKKDQSDKTYNNIMSSLRTFYNHLIKYEELKIKNLFTTVPVLSVEYNPQSFSKEEFNRVLSVTTNEYGYDTQKKRNRYKDWMPTAFKLGLFTCLRLGELVEMKYSDIVEVDGLSILESKNRKVNKLISTKSNQRIKRIPLIEELQKVLYEECDFKSRKGMDEYIIAPDLERSNVKNLITKGFTHFKRLAGIDENKCFKDLRTTYISRHRVDFKDIGFTATVSDHSNTAVVDRHYTAQIEAVKKSMSFRVFEDAEVRVN